MQRQGSFAETEYASKKKQTRRDKFLAEMEAVVPWPRLVARLALLYPKGERGRIRRANAAGRRARWNACCGSILCSNGTGWPMKRSRTPSTIAKRCAVLPGLR